VIGVTQLLVISAVLIAFFVAVPATAWAMVMLALVRRIPVAAVEDRESARRSRRQDLRWSFRSTR
jgi:hypothetical protein